MIRLLRRAGLAAGVAVSGLVLAACSAHPSIALNSGKINACYRAFPVAVSALHSKTRPQFRGVHRVAADNIERRFPQVTLPPGDNDKIVCAFAFHGSFKAGQVSMAPAGEQGSFAIVLVTSQHLHVVTSFVGDNLPLRFSRHLAE